MEANPILSAEELRKIYLRCTADSKCEQQTEYYSFLTSKGLTVNPKVTLSVFKLKNGLPYIGMAANQPIGPGQVLIRVPQELILSSAKAVSEPQLKQVLQDKFFINKDQNWQDRAIIVYCMFLLHQKDESNPWYHMIQKFPKECDIACFWPQQELDTFRDLTIASAAELDIKSFDQQWKEFEQCQKQYPILQGKQFNYENYKTIFINLTNRSFGKNINFASLVPFAEFFNHHCSKVYYTVEKEKKVELKDENVSDDESSVGSFDSNQYIEEGQFKYDEIDVTPYSWEFEESYELNKKQAQYVRAQVSRILNSLQNQLNWEDFTVLFVGHLILKIKIIEKQYLVGRKPYARTALQLKIIDNSLNNYRSRVTQYYKTTKKKDYMKKKEEKKPAPKDFTYPTYKKQYESLVMKTSVFDHIEPNNQIFFRYGRNSNRSLLLRYGFAIQGNKYEHAWISFSIVQCFQDFPDMLEKVMDKKLSLLRKFKIHHHILNMDIIIFFRLNNWTFYHEQAINEIFQVINIQKELAILQQIISILQDNLEAYAGEYDLTDKNLSYHQYFIAVYHKQKYDIIDKQISMLKKVVDILNAIEAGKTKEEATAHLSKSEMKVLGYYIGSIQTNPS